ncbi:hypothetical protein FHR92_005312 [Fontibacillus solani]|uniref:Uncharacterized protein n=1 Tax=Fontibacillus solani TaxID=1572857 RepID=A0A7W3SYV3_9BACL|nr:hypothetical protein [Fontibacillus solani]MBA9088779.1 hypothetical protein [Fontibacillus solani]
MGHWYYITPEEYTQAATNGVSTRTLEWRIREATWDKERAITTPPRRCVDHSNWHAIAEQNGIPRQLYLNRISIGWEPERAATEPILTQDKRAERMRNNNPRAWSYPEELINQAARNGVSRNTFNKRVNRGWSCERAASEPIVSSQECGRRGIRTLKNQRGDINAPIFNGGAL